VNEERDIGGHIFRFTKLGYRRARAVLVRTAKVLGPAMSGLSTFDTKKIADADFGSLSGVISAALDSLTDDDLEFVTQAFGECSSIKVGEAWAPLADEAKRGVYFDRTGLGVYLAWLRAANEVTYGDFFAELRAAAKSKPGGGTQAQ
jgi:hypothetical protein